MMETARILRQAGKRSLVVLDEIGRGTSTFDGLSLAWAVVEDLARRSGGPVRTLFATHYHELTGLEGLIHGVCNMNVAVMEKNGDITFTRRLLPGPADRSYGIEVARLAGVPLRVVQRAREILAQLDQTRGASAPARAAAISLPGLEAPPPQVPRPSPPPPAPEHPVLRALRDLDLDAITPLDALRRLTEWKAIWGEKRDPS
jgi:DNA mismatch repair protein MutS